MQPETVFNRVPREALAADLIEVETDFLNLILF